MAQIAVSPLVMKDVVLTIDIDTYEKHVSGVVFTPAQSQIEWRGLNPAAVFTDPGSTTWTCTLNYVQDWTTANSLSQYLMAQAGTSKDVVFKPQSGSGPTFEATVIIVPGAIGGEINTYATTSVTLGLQGPPVLVPAI